MTQVDNSQSLGLLDVLSNGAGFIRRPEGGYTPGKRDVYVGPKLIRRHGLRTGDEIVGEVGKRQKNGKSAPLMTLELVNGQPPEKMEGRPEFNRLGALHPDEPLRLECGRTLRGQPDLTLRIMDLLCPFGKGQRALIVAPPKAGKTTVLQAVAQGIATNHPETKLFVVLVDERPEEVTEMELAGYGEVVSSSFDHPPSRHVAVAEMILERSRRLVEMGQDVAIILDSITRLARSYNTVDEGSGRTLSGGLDATSMEKPKRFLGSARKIDQRKGGGSLTIIATALIDTGSKMDQVIFEEFKGTGNSELLLSRELADRRIFPALDIVASSTRREELLLSDEALEFSRTLRKQLSNATPVDAMNLLITEMKRSKNNEELLQQVAGRMKS